MKQITTVILLFITFFYAKAQQPDFKFYLAFEDSTGAKDTVWAIWDTVATGGFDPVFNDQPQSLPNDTAFRVYLQYNASDSGKVKAIPYATTMMLLTIKAQNGVYPITMYWDTVLMNNNNLPFPINSGILDNEYFFAIFNDPVLLQMYNMMITDSAEMPFFGWGSQSHFPLTCLFGYDPFLAIDGNFLETDPLLLYPNPSPNNINIKIVGSTPKYHRILIRNINGTVVMEVDDIGNFSSINIESIPRGIYFIQLTNNETSLFRKFIKN